MTTSEKVQNATMSDARYLCVGFWLYVKLTLDPHILRGIGLSTFAFAALISHAWAESLPAQPASDNVVITGSDVQIVRKFRHEWAVSAMAWSPDGKLLATLSNFFQDVAVWDVGKGEKRYEFRLQLPFSNVLTFTPDSKYILTGPDKDVSRGGHTSATLWDMGTGQVAREIDGPFPDRQPVDNVAEDFVFSHDGKLLALIAQKGPGWPFALYKTDDWTIFATISIPRDTPYSLAFSPDDHSLAVGTVGGKIAIIDMSSRTLARTIDAYNEVPVLALCYSPDGTRIASGHGLAPTRRQPDGTWKDFEPSDAIRIWNVVSGALVRSYPGRLLEVYALSWRPNDQTLVSAAKDFTVRSWSLDATGEHRTLLTFMTPSMGVAFGPEGTSIAAIGDNLAIIAKISR